MAAVQQPGVKARISPRGVLLPVVLVVAVGLGLRLHHLRVFLPANPVLVADSIEYKEYGEYLVGMTHVRPIADRPPGFPLLMGMLYTLFPVQGEEAVVQVWTTVVADAVAVGAAFAVASQLGGRGWGWESVCCWRSTES